MYAFLFLRLFLRRQGIALSVVMLFVLTACMERTPNLEKKPWMAIRVFYCVGTMPDFEMKVWETNDPAKLELLRTAYGNPTQRELWSAFRSVTNQIEIVDHRGDVWIVHLRSPDGGVVNPATSTHASHALYFQDRRFHDALVSMLSEFTDSDHPLLLSPDPFQASQISPSAAELGGYDYTKTR